MKKPSLSESSPFLACSAVCVLARAVRVPVLQVVLLLAVADAAAAVGVVGVRVLIKPEGMGNMGNRLTIKCLLRRLRS